MSTILVKRKKNKAKKMTMMILPRRQVNVDVISPWVILIICTTDVEEEEEFLRQVKSDKEKRANMNMNLFKSTHTCGKFIQETETLNECDDDDDDDDSDDQCIRLEELKDGLALDEGPDSSRTSNIDSNTHELVDSLDVEERSKSQP